jgi:hypothetical protein
MPSKLSRRHAPFILTTTDSSPAISLKPECLESMRIDGLWRVCDDGVVRPVLRAHIRTADGTWHQAPFLLDSGADSTVFSADVLDALGIPPVPAAQTLEGIGGQADSVLIPTQISLIRETGDPVLFTGQFAAVTKLKALDMSVLGRDITNLFGVLVDRPQDLVCLVGAKHRCVVVEA